MVLIEYFMERLFVDSKYLVGYFNYVLKYDWGIDILFSVLLNIVLGKIV